MVDLPRPVPKEEITSPKGVDTPKALPRAIEAYKPSFEFAYNLRDWEADYAAKYNNLYAVSRTIADIVPWGKFVFPSGRDFYANKNTKDQTWDLVFEAMSVVPFPFVGKGVKILAGATKRGLATGFRHLPVINKLTLPPAQVALNPYGDALMQANKFIHRTPTSRLMREYGLAKDEAEFLLNKGGSLKERPTLWTSTGRSGGMTGGITEALQDLMTSKGALKKPVKDNIKLWTSPREAQELAHTKAVAKQAFRFALGKSKIPTDSLFKVQAVRVYGKAGADFTWDTIGRDELGNILLDTLQHGGKLRRQLDITSWSAIKPIRKVFGSMQGYGAYNKFYKPLKGLMRTANEQETVYHQWFSEMLQSRKLNGKPLLEATQTTMGDIKYTRHFSRAEQKEAGELATQIDLAQGRGATAAQIQSIMDKGSPKAQVIAKTLGEWYDKMYADYFGKKTRIIFDNLGLTEKGALGFESKLLKTQTVFDDALRPGVNMSYQGKVLQMRGVLQGLKEEIAKKNFDWYSSKPYAQMSKLEQKELQERISFAMKELTPRTGKSAQGFVDYLENYTARIPKQKNVFSYIHDGIPVNAHAAFTKPRQAKEAYDVVTEIERLVGHRASAQTNELIVYPKMKYFSDLGKTYPENLKAYSSHYINRLLGNPSKVDASVADWIGRTLGGNWDDRRVLRLARNINDLVYMGGIGFKPFSAMRNYLQPILMTPADMGGIKDVYWLVRGYGRAFTPEGRAYIRSIGAIQEFTPDLLFRKRTALHASRKQSVRDASMWMFKGADRHNRYVSGGAASAKWDHYVEKFGRGGLISDTQMRGFKKKLNINSREKWVREELEDTLSMRTHESMQSAKDIFVNDVIADTQYLYGITDSPIITHTWGAPGKVGLVFQSWWMNYASSMGKWLFRTPGAEGAVDASTKRMFAWMLSSAVAGTVADRMWGPATAARTVGLGPLPTSVDIPPTFKPAFEVASALAGLAANAIAGEAVVDTKRKWIAALKSSMMFVPGGLQLTATVPPLVKGDTNAALKSIIKYRGHK